MNIPLSWLKEYVDIDLPLPDLAHLLTMIGLEVDAVHVIGLPLPNQERHEFKFEGLAWDPQTIVVAQIDEVMPHPNADRLVLCRLNDGQVDHVVLTGAPNLYPYKGTGPLPAPIKVAYAKEGATLYDGHQPGQVLTTLKRTKIRGVESYSMVCSEKELGISEEHEGVIFLDPDAPTGMSLVDYMGDAVFEISILPNMIRNASVLGVARELAAATGKPLRKPRRHAPVSSAAKVDGKVSIQITKPELNPRFVLGMVTGVQAQPSPYWVQRRLRLAGMRPINSIVDATNYVMLEVGQPLHAFDYDLLLKRSGGKAPTIITRTAAPGETLTTLDKVERKLDDFTVLVADTAGSLSIAGVMGGLESEVVPETTTVLLEGASWNFINIRRTVSAQRLNSEAGYRFSRGVHPELAPYAVDLCLGRIAEWSGGEIAAGLVDEYPLPQVDPVVTVTVQDVRRALGIDLSAQHIAELLTRLEFTCTVEGDAVRAATPPHRMDIGEGLIGVADLVEEIARMYGYNNIPSTRLSDPLPPPHSQPMFTREEHLRDILTNLGLQETATYRTTSPEREARAVPLDVPVDQMPYVRLANPISPERSVMRRSLLTSLLEVLERNIRLSDRLAFFEIGPVFLPRPDDVLPAEPRRVVIVLSGKRQPTNWDRPVEEVFDFFDLKGLLEQALDELHVTNISYARGEHPSFHPGKCAQLVVDGRPAGVFGELHPQVHDKFDFGANPVQAAELDLDAILVAAPVIYTAASVPAFPPVLEDLAVVVEEATPAGNVANVIRQAGGKLVTDVRLFDIFRGSQVGAGNKSMAYSITYQAVDRTLTDSEVTQVRNRIIRALERDVSGKVRSA